MNIVNKLNFERQMYLWFTQVQYSLKRGALCYSDRRAEIRKEFLNRAHPADPSLLGLTIFNNTKQKTKTLKVGRYL